jgi:hypothetical protein
LQFQSNFFAGSFSRSRNEVEVALVLAVNDRIDVRPEFF